MLVAAISARTCSMRLHSCFSRRSTVRVCCRIPRARFMFPAFGAADNQTDEPLVPFHSDELGSATRWVSRYRADADAGPDAGEAAQPRLPDGRLRAPTKSGNPTRQGLPRFPNRRQTSECVLWT